MEGGKYSQILLEIEEHRLKNSENLDQLEMKLEEVRNKNRKLQQKITNYDVVKREYEEDIRNLSKENEFLRIKLNQLNPDQLDIRLNELRQLQRDLFLKRAKLSKLQDELELYRGLEPTNESLRAKIEELNKNRLSLDMSFVDQSPWWTHFSVVHLG